MAAFTKDILGAEPFVDPIGRVSDKPRDQESGITDNPLLFSGEMALLIDEIQGLSPEQRQRTAQILNESEVVPGLFRRQPKYYQDEYQIPWNSVSHDEYNGVCFLAVANRDLRSKLRDVIDYGRRNFWQYNDLHPNSNFFRSLLRRPITTIKQFIAYQKDNAANPDDTNSVDLRHPADVTALPYIRQPRDIAFYKIVAGMGVSLFEDAYLALAIVNTAFGSTTDGSRGGSMLMAWFRMIAIRALPTDLLFVDLAHKFFNYRLKSKYGKNYAQDIAKIYFDRRGPNGESHPMIELIGQIPY